MGTIYILAFIMPLGFFLSKKYSITRPWSFHIIGVLMNIGIFKLFGFIALLPMIMYDPSSDNFWTLIVGISLPLVLISISFFSTRALAIGFSEDDRNL